MALLPHFVIEQRLLDAVRSVLPDAELTLVQVRPCPDPKFGDYQSASLMALAKQRKTNPRQLAADVVAKLDVSDLCEKVEIAGAGFLNFRLKLEAVAAALAAASRGEHLFFTPAARPRTVVVDFSSPNVAKPMHVGHIRSTILGDSLARTLRLLGHRVVTDNHLGDWGTQFGMLLVGWKRHVATQETKPAQIETLVEIYRKIQNDIREETKVTLKRDYSDRFKEMVRLCGSEDEAVSRVRELLNKARTPGTTALEQMEFSKTEIESRSELASLQQGDVENRAIWNELIRLSQREFDMIYHRLGVKFDETRGESSYNDQLAGLVHELSKQGITRESEGAICVFSNGTLPSKEDPFLVQRDGKWEPNPQIVQKSDGAFNYATTDLATLAYRIEKWSPDEVIYVTDGRQQLHFQQVFSTFRRWQPDAASRVKLAHVWFGSILGDDGKPFKTRSGETVKLAALLDEAEERALKLVTVKRPEIGEEERREIARVVGIGAVKYQDLLPNRQSDYVFSWERAIAFEGNTGPYLQYAYTRTRSLARKAEESGVSILSNFTPTMIAAEETALAKHLLTFGITLQAAADDYRPNLLCNYLYELAGLLSRFWENCPVLKAEEPLRSSRLLVSDLTGRVLKQGLDVLGIETLDQM